MTAEIKVRNVLCSYAGQSCVSLDRFGERKVLKGERHGLQRMLGVKDRAKDTK